MKKIKINKQKTIIIITILLIGLIPILTIYNLKNPTTLNKIIANKIYKEPANKNFKDDSLYNCIIDTYNKQNNTSLPYTTNLTDEQLLTITSLSCDGSGKKNEEKITNADGIEKLTNLIYLNLYNNNLRTIDLSNNTNLKYLHLDNNNLTTIDLSNNVNLTELYLHGNNLSTIDVSNNTKLTQLNLGSNNLTTIDLSNNVNLTSLSLSNNKLSTIDVINNVNLTELRLSNNNLRTIDLSNNTNLTYLYLHDNKLSTIDLSNNVNLTELYLHGNNLSTIDVSNNVNLTNLELSSNNLSTIDLSNNTNLTDLDLYYNNLSTIDLSKNTKLTKLNLGSNNLTTIDLSSNVNLIELDFRYNYRFKEISLPDNNKFNFSVISAQKAKTKYIKYGTTKVFEPIEEYDMYLNSKISVQTEEEINTFKTNLGLKNLTARIYNDEEEVTTGKIKDGYILKIYDGEKELGKLTIEVFEGISGFKDKNLYHCIIDTYNKQNNTSLPYTTNLTDEQLLTITSLSCSGSGKTDKEKITNASGIEKLTNLTYLNLDNNNLSTIDVSNNTNLTYLYLNNNNLSIMDLSKNVNLTELRLSNNNLSTMDLSKNVNLTDLNSEYNNLSTIDLSNNTNLTYLYLEYNNLSTINLSNNTKLTNLYLKYNNLSTIDLSNNTNLTYLYLEYNNLSTINLSNNVNLTKLYLSSNNLSTIDVSNNTKLTQLNLGSNNLTTIDLSNNVNLTSLSLSNNKLSTIDVINNVNLTELRLSNNNLRTIDLSNNTNLKYLNLSSNNISTIDLSKNVNLTNLYLRSNNISTIDLSNNVNLTSLDLYNNNFTLGNVYLKKDASIKETRNIKLPSKFPISYEIENTEIAKYEEGKIIGLKPGNTKIIATLNGVKDSFSSSAKDIKVSGNIYVYDYTSEVYDLNKDYIYTGTNNFDKSKVVCTNCTTEVSNNKLIIKANDEVVKEYKLVKISSTTYNLNKDYIYTGTNDFDKSKVVCTNCTTEVSNNKLIIKVNTEVVKEYKLVKISSTTYNLSKDYIYTGTSNFDKSKITCTNCNIEISNNNLLIKINDQILDQYNLSKISSTKYDLSKDDIYLNQNETIDKSKITCTNCNIEVSNNKLIIKVNTDIVKEYTIKYNAPTYKKGDINYDGKVNILDVGKLFSHVRGKSIIKDESLLKECDLNNDGKVNILDVGKLFSFVRGKTKTL